MIAGIIRTSIANRLFVLVAAAALAVLGIWSVARTPLDALPDLSDTQVIIRTEWPGQTPRIVEDQVTYPLTTPMLSVPGVKAVRGFSFFGDSFVYVLFDDRTDLYWARSTPRCCGLQEQPPTHRKLLLCISRLRLLPARKLQRSFLQD